MQTHTVDIVSGQGAKPSTSGVTQTQTGTTITIGTNIHPRLYNKNKESK